MSAITEDELLNPGSTTPGGRILLDPKEGFHLQHRGPLSLSTMEKIFADVLFVLPMHSSPSVKLSFLPNPSKRFCLDLRNPIDWFHSKKLRRHLRPQHFKLVVKCSLSEDLTKAKDYHVHKSGSTWLTDDLIKQLHSLSLSRRCVVQCYSFSLVDVLTSTVCATSFGFLSGCVYEDYTMATFARDNRSCGHLLSLLVGCVLQKAGVKLWYWGYETTYMESYRAHYGARDIERMEFYAVWREAPESLSPSLSSVFKDATTLPGVAIEVEDPPAQLVGRTVVITGLAAKPELNGREAVVLSFDVDKRRFAVNLRGDGGEANTYLLKEVNLRVTGLVLMPP